MRSLFLTLLSIIVFSCSSSKMSSTKSDSDKSASNVDCTEAIKEYVTNNQGLITNSTERYSVDRVLKQTDGTYKVVLRWVTGNKSNSFFGKEFSVDEDCKVLKVK